MSLVDNCRWVRERLPLGVVFLLLVVGAVTLQRLQAQGPQRPAEQTPAHVKDADLSKRSDGWGPECDGLRTRLLPAQEEYVVGLPARFRLEMKNFGAQKRTYDPQRVDVNDSMRVSDPAGKPVRYVGGSCQTGGSSKAIAPGQTMVLFKGLDLANQYLFVKPGSYSIQFRGTNVKWHSESEIPTSNKITVQMQPGTVPLSMQVPARLVEILPEGWDVSLNGRGYEVHDGKITPPGWESGRGTYVSLMTNPSKRDGWEVGIWVAEHELTWTGKARTGEAAKPGKPAIHLGKGADGHVYWTVPEKAGTKWPDIRARVRAGLQIGPLPATY